MTRDRMGASASAPIAPATVERPKKMCCACPETKKARDECVVERGEADARCQKLIEAHTKCLRAEGFDV